MTAITETLFLIWQYDHKCSVDQLMYKRDQFTKQAKVLRALAHESRLMIVNRLSHGECSVGDLCVLVGGDASTVSKHLALLRAHGVVGDRREKTTVYYRLLTPCVCSLFTCATQALKERGRSGTYGHQTVPEIAQFARGTR